MAVIIFQTRLHYLDCHNTITATVVGNFKGEIENKLSSGICLSSWQASYSAAITRSFITMLFVTTEICIQRLTSINVAHYTQQSN